MAFSREHELRKRYSHHSTAESFHEAKRLGCHFCSVLWEVFHGKSTVDCGSHQPQFFDFIYEFDTARRIYFSIKLDEHESRELIFCPSLVSESEQRGFDPSLLAEISSTP